MVTGDMPDYRALVEAPRSGFEVLMEWLAIAGTVLCVAVVASAWPSLPDRAPTHFGLGGQPDRWGPRESILIIPGAALLIYALMTVSVRYPRLMNYPVRVTPENRSRQYLLARRLLISLKAEIVWMFAYISWQTTEVAAGRSGGLGETFMVVFLVVIFGTVGAYFAQAFRAR